MTGLLHELIGVEGSDGVKVAFGERQRDWLLSQGLIVESYRAADGTMYKTEMTGRAISDLVLATRACHECDFCGEPEPDWRVMLRHPIKKPPPQEGPIDRPMFLCGECAGLIERNDKRGLLDRCIEVMTGRVCDRHGVSISLTMAKREVGPMIKPLIDQLWGARMGRPVKTEGG